MSHYDDRMRMLRHRDEKGKTGFEIGEQLADKTLIASGELVALDDQRIAPGRLKDALRLQDVQTERRGQTARVELLGQLGDLVDQQLAVLGKTLAVMPQDRPARDMRADRDIGVLRHRGETPDLQLVAE